MDQRGLPLLRIFLGSPGDVPEERKCAREVVRQLNEASLLRDHVSLKCVAWEDVSLPANHDPQEAITRGLPRPSDCDLAIFVFGRRMGTPLPAKYVKPDGDRYHSGTEWELLDALKGADVCGKPTVLVYRLAGRPREEDEQWHRLVALFSSPLFRNEDGSIRRAMQSYTGPMEFERRLVNDLQLEVLRLLDAKDRRVPVVGSDGALIPPNEAYKTLRRSVCGDGWPTKLAHQTIDKILVDRPRNLEQYHLLRIAEWSHPQHQINRRFVRLTLLLDRGETAWGPRFKKTQVHDDLRHVLAETHDFPALVLLGPPGCGKSTLLRRLELDAAVEALQHMASNARPQRSEPLLTFFVELNRYNSSVDPVTWLEQQWSERFRPALPALIDLLRQGRMALLLDGLNEIPHSGWEEYQGQVSAWRRLLLDLRERYPGNRVVFSCRTLDYSAPLSSPELRVPQVRIERLAPDRIHEFVVLYSPTLGEKIWDEIEGSPALELLGLPFFLRLLVEQVEAVGEVPRGRAGLLTGFVRQALRREIERECSIFKPDRLLSRQDIVKVIQNHWSGEHDLPSGGALFKALSRLADRMQRRRVSSDTSQVRIGRQEAMELLPRDQGEDILSAGAALAVIEEDPTRPEVRFVHQLLQEYFAARRLVDRLEPDLVHAAWRIGDVKPSLEEIVAQIAESDPLPGLPTTGWEETARLAAAMARDPDEFVGRLKEANLPLAALSATDRSKTVSPSTLNDLRLALLDRIANPKADLRARIEAGLALGEIGHPRFEARVGPLGEFLLPPIVEIQHDQYTIGSDETEFQDEQPVHRVEIGSFAIACFPVTNNEWYLFMKAGGYENEQWWTTPAARAWRRDGNAEGTRRYLREWREQRRHDLEPWCQGPSVTPLAVEQVRRVVLMPDEEFENELAHWYPPGRQTRPSFWNEATLSGRSQPVVGICWHEARAYCSWLSAQTGEQFCLPSEVEWEAVAGGKHGRRFAYGNRFDAAHCNTSESHVRRTTAVDIFPSGRTPENVADLTGNVWEWTSSLYHPYPYDPLDGREDVEDVEEQRVLRGGSWLYRARYARTAARSCLPPDFRGHDVGFRVVMKAPRVTLSTVSKAASQQG